MKKNILIFFLFVIQFSFSQNKKAASLIEKGIEYLHTNNFEKAIHTFNESQNIIDNSFSYQEQFLIYNNKGLIYYKMSDYKEATQYFEKAYKLAKEANKPQNEMTVLNNLAILFIKISKYENAKKYLEQAFQIAKEENDLSKYAIYAINLGSINYDLKDYKSTKIYLNNIKEIDQTQISERVLKNYQILLNKILVHDGEVKKAIENLKKLLETCSDKSYNDECYEIHLSIAKAYLIEKEHENALRYADLALKLTDSAEKKKETFEQISKIYFEKNEFNKAFQAKDSMIKYSEIIQQNINKESIENARLNFELLKSNYEVDSQKERLLKDRKFYIIIFIFFVIVCFLVIFLINKRHQNTKQKNILINQNLLIKEYEYNNLLDIKNSLKNELLILKKTEQEKTEISNELEIEYQEKSKIRNQLFEKKLLLQITRNQLLTELLDEIVNRKTESNPENTFNIIQKLKIHIKDDLQFIDDIYQTDFKKDSFIVTILKFHPNLNTNELRFLTLIYLQTDTKEIAQLLFITPETVRKRKERLKFKLGLDKNNDLFDYLHKIK